ncbi:hypothetical protein LZ32DRAFT_655280 [Colletotrichum eremochloae]|nr:hypothetical protein LZ32DRAFT_655280 [Colletotrichum eremochloae]
MFRREEALLLNRSVEGPGQDRRKPKWVEVFETEYPVRESKILPDLKLFIRAAPPKYSLGNSCGNSASYAWRKEFDSEQIHPSPRYSNFEGSMFALFVTGNEEPWSCDACKVGSQSPRSSLRGDSSGL